MNIITKVLLIGITNTMFFIGLKEYVFLENNWKYLALGISTLGLFLLIKLISEED